MQFDTHSKATGKLILVRLDSDEASARLNARSCLTLCGVNPDDGITSPSTTKVSHPDLERYGEYWPEGSEVHVEPSYPDQTSVPGSGL